MIENRELLEFSRIMSGSVTTPTTGGNYHPLAPPKIGGELTAKLYLYWFSSYFRRS